MCDDRRRRGGDRVQTRFLCFFASAYVHVRKALLTSCDVFSGGQENSVPLSSLSLRCSVSSPPVRSVSRCEDSSCGMQVRKMRREGVLRVDCGCRKILVNNMLNDLREISSSLKDDEWMFEHDGDRRAVMSICKGV
eukprot:650712-Hanusia_phi.AAC.2